MRSPPSGTATAFAFILCCVAQCAFAAERTLLIAPSIDGQEYCPSALADPAIDTDESAAAYCAARNENSAKLIASFLDGVGPVTSPSGHFKLGYELDLPLMRYYKKEGGNWVLDRAALRTRIRTIAEVQRPVVVYLSANHFTDGGLTLSGELARDPANLMWTKDGPLRDDRYFTVSLNAWTLSDFKAPINIMREQAFRAAIDEICLLKPTARDRIAAVSLLGEVHQLFPDFLSGPGYAVSFNVTDYAPNSITLFRDWLKQKFGRIEALNAMAGSSFGSFEEISPPSKDIRKDTLKNFFEHIDAFAAGIVPIYGWAYDPSGQPATIAVYLDGKKRGEVPANLNRSDVSEANAAVKDLNVGWRYSLDYRDEPPGVHTLDVVATPQGRPPIHMGTRQITVVDRNQSKLGEIPSAPVEAADPKTAPDFLFYIDGPAPLTPLFYNPLARLWLEYRNVAVTRYIEHFARIAGQSCLPKARLFSHQIMPDLNASWNADFMAVADSQHPNPLYGQGVTLYGGAAFGQAFFDWKNKQGWTGYSVGEIGPRTALTPDQFFRMFDDHRRNGAVYIAPYFMATSPQRVMRSKNALSQMVITPENHALGSDLFYAAIVDTVRNR